MCLINGCGERLKTMHLTVKYTLNNEVRLTIGVYGIVVQCACSNLTFGGLSHVLLQYGSLTAFTSIIEDCIAIILLLQLKIEGTML